jgi:hypothetical protein
MAGALGKAWLYGRTTAPQLLLPISSPQRALRRRQQTALAPSRPGGADQVGQGGSDLPHLKQLPLTHPVCRFVLPHFHAERESPRCRPDS